jgi:hypothetical protein
MSATIVLQNPVSDHFASFIFGNATMCDRVAQQNSAKGQHVVICGAGPSLAENAEKWCAKGDQVWGCNSALPYLFDKGYKVTHGITVDQTEHMVDEWQSAPDVEYLLASSSHPFLTEHLLKLERNLTFFHNFVGISKPPVAFGVCRVCNKTQNSSVTDCECGGLVRQGIMAYEDWLYASLYPPTIRCGSGLNTATRAIDLALFMGFSRISILGADCALRAPRKAPNAPQGSAEHTAWLNETVMHADGGNALASGATACVMDAEIDGRYWVTKPDMVISAQWLVHMAKKHGRRIKLVGDTLPNALMSKPKEFMDRLPQLTGSDGQPIGFF